MCNMYTRIHVPSLLVAYTFIPTHSSPNLNSLNSQVLHRVTGTKSEKWGSGVETQKNVREEIGGWGRVPFNEPYAPSLSTIYDGA